MDVFPDQARSKTAHVITNLGIFARHTVELAGFQAGFPVSEDFNGRRFEGYGRFDMNIWQGRRQSASATYLRPALERKGSRVRKELKAKAR